jgi:hypothetical protein
MQIGPRLRIGGTLGHIGQELKQGAGTVARFAAPIVSLGNPLLGAGIAAAGGALRGKSIADIVKEAAITGGTGYALGKVGGFFSGGEGGAGGAAGDLAPGGISTAAPTTELGGITMPTPTAATIVPTAAQRAASQAAGSGGGMFSAAVNYAKHNPKDVAIGAGYAANALLQNNANEAALKLERQRDEEERRRYNDQQARLDPVRAILAQWVAQRMGQPGAMR